MCPPLENASQPKQNKALTTRANARRSAHGALTIPRGLGPVIPEAALVDLPYALTSSLLSDTTTAFTYGLGLNLRVNNAFSPVQGTHQPYGWDQMAALYRFYKVVGFRYKLTFINSAAAATDSAVWFASRQVPVNENVTIVGQTTGYVSELPGSKVSLTAFGAGPASVHQGSVDIPRLLGITPEQYQADVSEYAAAVTAAPSRFAYIQIAAAGPATTSFGYVMIECRYRVHFWQRITQAQS